MKVAIANAINLLTREREIIYQSEQTADGEVPDEGGSRADGRLR